MEPYYNFAYNFTDSEALAASLAWVFMIVTAGLILVVGYFICKLIASLIGSGIDKVPFIKKVNEDDVPGEETVGHGIGQVLFYLLFLFVIAIALSVVGLSSVIQPVEQMWGEILTYLPNIIAAVVILGLGLLLATVVRKLTESVLEAVGADSFFHTTKPADRAGTVTTSTTAKAPLSSAIGWIVFTLIAIPVILASVEALAIESITTPVSVMLGAILAAIPRIFIALVILAISYLIARFVAGLIERVLPQFGFDDYFAKLGLIESKEESGLTATKAVSAVTMVAIMLFGAVEATRVLDFQVLSDFVAIVIEQGGQILFGTLIIAFGFFFANIVGRVLDATGSGISDNLALVVKVAIMVLSVILGVSRMGLDPKDGIFILNIAEYLVMAFAVAVGVGGAIAFGLGGREWAGRKLEEWSAKAPSMKKPAATTSAAKPATTRSSSTATKKKTPSSTGKTTTGRGGTKKTD
tara:strand:+ start:29975 stop:31375 length:1401 start_codon:yes stop_codon:yes gene_type:complete